MKVTGLTESTEKIPGYFVPGGTGEALCVCATQNNPQASDQALRNRLMRVA